MRESQICIECQNKSYLKNKNFPVPKTQDIENVAEEDIDISKGQADLLKIIVNLIPKEERLSEFTLNNLLEERDDVAYFIKENWGSKEHFIYLALNERESNQISQILNFLNLKNKIGRVPTKQDMKELSIIGLGAYEKKFTAWENFLDLLGFDPWYKNNNLNIAKNVYKKNENNKTVLKKEDKKYSNIFLKEDTKFETDQKINKIRMTINEKYEKLDLKENYADYSYAEMFELLEKYLDIMPNKSKYSSIKDLL